MIITITTTTAITTMIIRMVMVMVMVTVMGRAATAMRRSTLVAPSPSAPD